MQQVVFDFPEADGVLSPDELFSCVRRASFVAQDGGQDCSLSDRASWHVAIAVYAALVDCIKVAALFGVATGLGCFVRLFL